MMSMLLPKIPQALKDIFQYKTVSFSPIPEDAYGLSVQYGTGDVQQSAVIWMKKVQWISVLSNQKFTSHVQPQLLPSFKFQSHVVLGYLSLGYVECSELEPGDLLFFEDSYFSLNGKGRIKIGNINFDVNLEKSNNQYQVVVNSWSKDMVDQDEYLSEREEVISEDMAVSLDGAEKNGEGRKALQVPVSDIPVKLSVKLGTIEFTVADLGKMLEGKVYPIDSMCPGKVQLMANGMELARGQLVEVDGKLAVEVQRRWIQP
jgi:type III secretion protein Q